MICVPEICLQQCQKCNNSAWKNELAVNCKLSKRIKNNFSRKILKKKCHKKISFRSKKCQIRVTNNLRNQYFYLPFFISKTIEDIVNTYHKYGNVITFQNEVSLAIF